MNEKVMEALDYLAITIGDWVPLPTDPEQSLATIRAHIEGLEADARRWRAMRLELVAVDFQPEIGGGPVVMFSCYAKRVCAGPDGADLIADAAIDSAMQENRDG